MPDELPTTGAAKVSTVGTHSSHRQDILARLTFIVGLSFLWPFIRWGVPGTFFSTAVTGSGLPTTAYYVLIVAFGILSVCFGTKLMKLVRRRALYTAMLVLGMVDTLALVIYGAVYFTPGTEAAVPLFALALPLVLTTFMFCSLAILWGVVASQSPICLAESPTLLVDAAISYALSYVFALPAYAIGDYSWVVYALSPAISCLMLFFFPMTSLPNDRPLGTLKDLKGWKLLLIVVFFIFSASILVGLYGGGEGGRESIAAFIVALLLVPLMYVAMSKPRLVVAVWSAALLVVLAGAMLVLGLSDTFSYVGSSVLVVGRRTLRFLLWVFVLNAIASGKLNPFRMIGLFFLVVYGAASLITRIIGMTGLRDAVPSQHLMVGTFVLTLILIVCAFIIIIISVSTVQGGVRNVAASENKTTGGEKPAPSKDLRHEACKALANAHGLTEREATILEYLSQGNTIQKIADIECVTPNTVRTHVRSVYTKLDLHAKQQIIDLVNTEMGKRS